MIIKNKKARFMPFWIMLGILGVLLIGSFITPIRITLDSAFENIEESATANGTPELSCLDPSASGIHKGTCFVLGSFMAIPVLYILYQFVTAMTNGSKKNTAVFGPRLAARRQALGA